MKKNVFFALAAIVFGIALTSCSSEEMKLENAGMEIKNTTVQVSEETFNKATSIAQEVDGTRCHLTMFMGNEIVNEGLTTYVSEGMHMKGFDNPEVIESPAVGNTKTVKIVQRIEGEANVFEVQETYTVVKENVPEEPAEPTIIREYLAADTTMIYKASSSGVVRVYMQHKLHRITEWSDARVDSAEIWNKKFQVAMAKVGVSEGEAYSRTEAKAFKHSASLSWFDSAETQDESFNIVTRKGEFVYIADYINDANYPMKSDHHVIAEESTVKCSYEGYEAVYDFHWATNFVGQEVVDKNLPDEARGNYTYQYEANSISSWNVSLSGNTIGTHKVDVKVYRYFE